jgi:uncharacterized protein YndB with AHSA1/START domain
MSQEVVRIEKTIVIDRPLEAVWEHIVDGRNDPEWCKKVISVQQVTGGDPGPGASYLVVHRPRRLEKPKELAVTVQEFNPPRRMRVREEDDDSVFYVTYDLEPAGAGTRLTQRDQIEWRIPRFQRPIARWMVGRDIENQLSTLKRVLESRG